MRVQTVDRVPPVWLAGVGMDGWRQNDVRAVALDINASANIRLVDDPTRRRHKRVMVAPTASMTKQDMPHVAVALLQGEPRRITTGTGIDIGRPIVCPQRPADIGRWRVVPPGGQEKRVSGRVVEAVADLAA